MSICMPMAEKYNFTFETDSYSIQLRKLVMVTYLSARIWESIDIGILKLLLSLLSACVGNSIRYERTTFRQRIKTLNFAFSIKLINDILKKS